MIFAIASVIAAGAVSPAEASAAESHWVHPGPNGMLAYQATSNGDRIMDFSHAGYMGGGVALPDVPVKRTVQPSGGLDDTAAIQSAINEVAGLKMENGFCGTVLLGPGMFRCSNTLTLSASGVVLRGSGTSGESKTTIKLLGRPHLAIAIRAAGGSRLRSGEPAPPAVTNSGGAEFTPAETRIADIYVPSGATTISVGNGAGFRVGDKIEIRRPVTEAWIKFMQMHDLVRDGRPQTWIRAGSVTITERRISGISGNKLTLDVPLADSFDSKYLNPPGAAVVKIRQPPRITHCGIEALRIESPPQAINHTQPHFTALRISGEDCWVREVICDETMNSVAVGGRRITLQRVAVNRQARHEDSSKPAEFAPNGGQILLDRCYGIGDNVWYSATGGGQAGPIVLLNCTFQGNGRIESHQRWTTGVLYDNCRVPGGGIDFRNRGAMGSGHGWTMGWGVMWNCVAESFVSQDPPGVVNWMIGCVGPNRPMPRPFDREPNLPVGTMDSHGTPVTPQSLYLAQLAERLGPKAVKNIGY